ncbi:hypothetical protein KUTeg_012300 [Tegillarca granosa]|uniref:Sodium-dependent multivitamin transporter n=1 Tax=Tegillarca granosa TaxID=220873 RepID=A0ABQ9F2N4_TEGGR|nr:hypothetical protein KUTeg_012300 [Tegillarca granosa]
MYVLLTVTGFPLWSSIIVVAIAAVIYTAIVRWYKSRDMDRRFPKFYHVCRVMWITTPAFLVTLFLAAVEGVVAYSYYHTVGCDPLASKQIRDPNQVVPFMVMDIFNGIYGMPGLFLASLFSASLSTLSSGLSSLSALLWTDLIKPHIKPISDTKATIIAKVSVIGFGCFAIAIAFLVSTIGGTLTQISGTIISAFSGPLTGLFFLGCFVPYANSKGALVGGLFSVVYSFWLAFGKSTSKSAKRTTPLPPAPSDMCLPTNLTNGVDWLLNNTTDMMARYTEYTTTGMPSTPIEP